MGTPFWPDISAFKNFMASASYSASDPAFLTADQYPTGTLTSAFTMPVTFPSNLTGSDTLVFAWTGTLQSSSPGNPLTMSHGSPGFTVTVGASSFVNGATSSNINLYGVNGYIEFNFNGTVGGVTLSFNSGWTFSGLSSIIFCKKSDYASIVAASSAGDLISDTYIADLVALNPSAIRPMTYPQPNNANNFTQHRYRNNWRTAISYASRWIPSCLAPGGTSGTNAYTCAAAADTPVAYTDGEVLQVEFINASTLTPLTINVGSRGVVPLFSDLGQPLTSISANKYSTLIYDTILGGYIYYAGGYTARVPVEILVGMANRVGCALWYTFPPHITTADTTMEPVGTDKQTAALIASTLNKGCYFEWANEVWNTAGAFDETIWAGFSGAALGFPNTIDSAEQIHSFYGYKIAVIMPRVTTAWGGKAGLKCCNMTQAFGDAGVNGATNKCRLQGLDLGPRTKIITNITSSAATPTVSSAAHGYSAGQGLVLTMLAGTMGTLLNGITVYVSATGLTTNAYQLSSSSNSNVPIDTSGATYSSGGSSQTLYSFLGHADYTSSPNRPVDVSDVFGYATYYSGAQCTNGFAAGYASNMPGTGLTTGGPASGPGSAISGLLGAADAYATDPTNALAWLDWDFRQGTNGGSAGGQTLLALLSGANGVGIYPAWESIVASYDSSRPPGKSLLTVECYEGAMEAAPPTTAQCAIMGIATTYSMSISTLLNAYKSSSLFAQLVTDQFNQFLMQSHSKNGAWFNMTGGNQWSMYPGDIYTAPWQSYQAVATY